MKKLLLLLVTFLGAAILGINVITPQEKTYLPASYYQPEINSSPDYKGLYAQLSGNQVATGQECNKGKRSTLGDLYTHYNASPNPFSAGKFWIYTFRQFSDSERKSADDIFQSMFLGSRNTDIPKKQDNGFISDLNAIPDDDVNVYHFTGANNCVVAPGTGYIPLNSMRVDNIFPASYSGNKATASDGVTFSYIVTPTEKDPNYYKFIFGGVSRMWCCMLKDKPDDYADKAKTLPLYKHSYSLQGQQAFEAGDILAQCGNTAVPDVTRKAKPDLSVLLVKVYKSPDGSAWAPTTLKSFYYDS